VLNKIFESHGYKFMINASLKVVDMYD